jgi:hypothetical protein
MDTAASAAPKGAVFSWKQRALALHRGDPARSFSCG